MALTTADRIEIGELIAKFAHFSDYGDWDALATCFTDDVVTCIAGKPAYVGIPAQVAHARNSAEWTQNQNRHVALNLWIEPEGDDAARAHYYLLNFVCGTELGAAKIVVSARMTDHVVRRPTSSPASPATNDGAGTTFRPTGWRIARRELEPDQPFPVPDANAE
jgi:SnoaL-like domain